MLSHFVITFTYTHWMWLFSHALTSTMIYLNCSFRCSKGVCEHCYLAKIYHYNDVIMGTMASRITSLTIVYSTVHAGADQRKHQSSASLAVVRGIRQWLVNSPHKWPVTRKMFPFNDSDTNKACAWFQRAKDTTKTVLKAELSDFLSFFFLSKTWSPSIERINRNSVTTVQT